MDNNLITINYNGDNQTVLGRELHEFLEVKTQYKDWFPRMCEYGFTENEDFNSLKNEQVQMEGNRSVSRTILDHQMTVEMAKEISMLQRSDKGKLARQYFIELEKKWNSPEAVMARALNMANKTIENLKSYTYLLEVKIEEQKPLVGFAETCLKSKDNILVRQVSKIAQDEGIDIGEKKLYKKLREWGLILTSSTEPSQRGMNSLYFVVEEKSVDTPYGVKLSRITKVSPKGQVFIIEKLKKELL